MLIEALVAVALVAICAGAALAAVVAVTHAAAHAAPAPGFVSTAQNVLTDLRAATAYDAGAVAALAGRSTEFDVDEPGSGGTTQRVHITIAVTAAANGADTATVTVRSSAGAATAQTSLAPEAPAPGTVLPASTPAPAAARAPDDAIEL